MTINIVEIDKIVFFNTLGLVPNGLRIVKINGDSEKFVVNERRQWKDEIMKKINRA